ncbi:MAG: SPOR domain-containing protein [Vicinamibacterales bacterium]
MTAHTQDDAFHEIQLNGKQLVFLVMTTTVVSVAIFLLGVLVGRNVRAERSGPTPSDSAASLLAGDPLPPPVPPSPGAQVQVDADPRVAAPPPTLGDADVKRETDAAEGALKPAAPRPEVPAAPPRAAATPLPVPAPVVSPKAVEKGQARSAATEPARTTGRGYAVQVAAINVRSEADAIARRLSGKGYAAYVQVPTSGSVYRVRVGTFKTRREADSVAARLQKEEQFKPWVTR